jgi:hypothetical protein
MSVSFSASSKFNNTFIRVDYLNVNYRCNVENFSYTTIEESTRKGVPDYMFHLLSVLSTQIKLCKKNENVEIESP